MDGDSHPSAGGQPILHVERLTDVQDKTKTLLLTCQEGCSPLLPLSLLERVECVAVPIHGAGAAAEHPDHHHYHHHHHHHPRQGPRAQPNLPLLQTLPSLERAELDHVDKVVTDTEADTLRDVHVVKDEPLLPANNVRNILMALLGMVFILLFRASVWLDDPQSLTGRSGSVLLLQGAVLQLSLQPLAVDPVLVADRHCREKDLRRRFVTRVV